MKYLLIARVKVQSDKIIGLGKILVTTKKLVIFLRFFFSNKVYHKTRNLLFSDVLEISKPVISTEECNIIIKGHKMSAKKWTGGVIHKVFLKIFQGSQKNSATFLQLVLQRYSSTNFGENFRTSIPQNNFWLLLLQVRVYHHYMCQSQSF